MEEAGLVRGKWYSILICAVSTLVLFCTLGLATSTISIYLPYIISDGGLTRTQGSFLLSLRSLSSLITIVAVVERFYRRVQLRWGIVCALILDVAAFSLYGVAGSYLQYCAAAVLAGAAYGIGGIIPVSILIGRWFKTDRSFAIGICTAGSGVATIVVPPAFVALAEGVSTQAAFLSMAGLIVLAAVLSVLVLRDSPEQAGQEPFCSVRGERSVRSAWAAALEEIDGTGRAAVLLGILLLGAASHSANQPRFASKRGTYDKDGVSFKRDVLGSDKSIAFPIPCDPSIPWVPLPFPVRSFRRR